MFGVQGSGCVVDVVRRLRVEGGSRFGVWDLGCGVYVVRRLRIEGSGLGFRVGGVGFKGLVFGVGVVRKLHVKRLGFGVWGLRFAETGHRGSGPSTRSLRTTVHLNDAGTHYVYQNRLRGSE